MPSPLSGNFTTLPADILHMIESSYLDWQSQVNFRNRNKASALQEKNYEVMLKLFYPIQYRLLQDSVNCFFDDFTRQDLFKKSYEELCKHHLLAIRYKCLSDRPLVPTPHGFERASNPERETAIARESRLFVFFKAGLLSSIKKEKISLTELFRIQGHLF